MKPALQEAHLSIQKARQALQRNDRGEARQWAEHAARLAPQLEDPWLVLATIAGPQASLAYIQRALKINPRSPRARRGMQWAMQRLQQGDAALTETQPTPAFKASTVRSAPLQRAQPRKSSSRPRVIAIALLALGCMVCAAAGWSATMSPVVASILPQALASPMPTAPSWSEVEIPKPTYTPAAGLADALLPSATPDLVATAAPAGSDLSTALSTDLPTDLPTAQPTEMAADLPTATPETSLPTAEPTWSGSLSMEVVPDTPTSEIPTSAPGSNYPPPGDVAGGTHWIDVNLTQQMVYAYAGNALMNSFLVSTGTWMTPTVTGKYHVYVKLRYTDMSGPDYYLPNVPYTMYFYKGYGLHGTYWHHNFGTPMSHGCVNLSIPDAAWLYDFSSVGTLVNVHY